MSSRFPARQRGAIGLIAALTLGMALLFVLLVVDSGRLYLEQRKLQRVVDMAALEAVNGKGTCLPPGPNAQTLAVQAATRNGHKPGAERSLKVECGSLQTGAGSLRVFTADASKADAIRVTASYTLDTSIAAGIRSLASSAPFSSSTRLSAHATAAQAGPPLARLNIRSTLLNIDSSRSALLNSLMSTLLGSQVNLSLAQWQGLLQANVNLLNYLDALAIKAQVTAGNYTELLGKTLQLGEALDVMAKVAAQNNPLVDVSGLAQLSVLAQNAGGIVLGDLLNIQNGGSSAGLDAKLQALQLVQGMVQLANSAHGAEVSLPVSLLGLANISTRVKIIEPPQFSALGNPAKATSNAKDPEQIYVRTAQTRILIKVDLGPLLGGINLGIIKVLPNPSLDVGLEVASASSHVTGYNCACAASKSLTVRNEAAAVKVLIGTINSNNFFSSTHPVDASPLVLLSVLGIDIGLGANSPVFSQSESFSYLKPPELEQDSANHLLSSKNIVSSVRNTLQGLELSPQIPLVSLLLNTVSGLIGGLLGALLDPIINNLLTLLGIDLNQVEIGANLSCHSGRAQLMI
ncbi:MULTISPECIES: pilus assembly protein TadG-related protein [Pseudomonas]|uniref:pilus assembly protein TadG-related protein n=1 Tax=Pseudomonas TaxID=286 RepID=UPI000691D4E9|nr:MULTISPECIES: pilus assembly protein TadG-related protein [Pseudomonas]